jgi:N-acetylglucosaminyldiphosphoundecaprenol N-acetyl-beta-D-mannosaminyltransferase
VKNIIDKLISSDYEVIKLVQNSIKNREKLLLTYLNQHCFNVYLNDKLYENLLDEKYSVYTDGIGMNLVNRFIFNKKEKQFNASDLNEELISFFIKNEIRFYLLGGNFTSTKIEDKLKSTTSFVGYNNGFFLDSEFENVIEIIKTTKPDVIIIGMGVPKQEIIAERLSRSINASLFLCVGNFFEFYLGTVKRIPKKFRNKGIEWIYRFYQEPKRLWKRYFIGIPLFIFRVIKFKFMNTKVG